MSSQAAGISEIHLEELLMKGHLRVALLALRGAPLALSEAASEIRLVIAIRTHSAHARERAELFTVYSTVGQNFDAKLRNSM
jgi:hypothetical protein